MSGATFDTLKFTETLRESGIPETQAKAISVAVRGAYDTSEIATKADLRETTSVLRAEMQGLRSELSADMQALRSELSADMQALRAEMRSDMQVSRAEAQSEMQSLRADVRSDIQRLDARLDRLEPQLTIRLGGLVVLALGAFTALSKWIG